MAQIPQIKKKGIGPAPLRLDPDTRKAWDDLVALCEPGLLIWRDVIWLELTAGSVALIRKHGIRDPDEPACVCMSLKGLNLGPEALPALGLDFEWKIRPDDDDPWTAQINDPED